MSQDDDSPGQSHDQQTGQPQQGQPGGQPGRQPGGQPGGQPSGQPGGQPAGQPGATQKVSEPSPTEVLTRPQGQAVLKHVVAVFTVLGVGVGLFTWLAGELFSQNQLIGGQVFGATGTAYFTLFFAGGPLLAAVTGLIGSFNVGQTDKECYLLGFVSAAVGHLALVVTTSVFVALASNSFPFGDALILGIFMAIATGLIAAGTSWAGHWSAS